MAIRVEDLKDGVEIYYVAVHQKVGLETPPTYGVETLHLVGDAKVVGEMINFDAVTPTAVSDGTQQVAPRFFELVRNGLVEYYFLDRSTAEGFVILLQNTLSAGIACGKLS